MKAVTTFSCFAGHFIFCLYFEFSFKLVSGPFSLCSDGLCDDLGLSILSYTDSEPTKNNGSSPGYLQEGLDYSFHGQNFSI